MSCPIPTEQVAEPISVSSSTTAPRSTSASPRAKAWQAEDDRVQIKEYDDLVTGGVTVHAFYVKYLLPIWFDVQVIER